MTDIDRGIYDHALGGYKPRELDESRREARDLIADLDWRVQKHIEQRELVASGTRIAGAAPTTSLSDGQYLELLAYKQALRDAYNLSQSTGAAVVLPPRPSFLE